LLKLNERVSGDSIKYEKSIKRLDIGCLASGVVISIIYFTVFIGYIIQENQIKEESFE
jgi:hypothetical protein